MYGNMIAVAVRTTTWVLLTSLAAGCSNTPVPGDNAQTAVSSARTLADLQVVDCLLSGQVRKLGQQMTFLTAGRAIKTTAADCAIRGGEYVAYDRSNYATALQVWLPQAQAGDATAQNYVGEIYEKGLGTTPDFGQAAQWYRKAAGQGHTRAQINLAYLYEKGQGVQKDFAEALRLYRQASGLGEGIALDTGEIGQLQQALTRSRQSEASLREELASTRRQLEQSRAALRKRKADAALQERRWEQSRRTWTQEQQQARVAGDDAGVRRLQEQLDVQAAQVRKSREDIARLEQEAARYKEQAQALAAKQPAGGRNSQDTAPMTEAGTRWSSDRTDATAQRDTAPDTPEPGLTGPRLEFIGPRIEIIEPPITLNRGLGAKIKVNTAMERSLLGKATSSLGIRELTVNGQATTFDDRGLFRTAVRVQSPDTPVTVVAIDKGGKRVNVQFQFVVERGTEEQKTPLPTAATASTGEGKYYALLIGNNDYAHLSTLNTPVHDVQALGQVLQTRYGFSVTPVINATRWQTLSALHALRAKLADNDNVLIYYAGHGDIDKVNQRGHWLPVDAERSNPANWISNVEVTDAINLMPARRILVIADSCYAGTLTRSALTQLANDATSPEQQARWVRALSSKRSRTVLSSGGEVPVPDSAGADPQHSQFAAALLQVLSSNREMLEGGRLYREVAARLAFKGQGDRGTQVPGYAPVKYAGHEAGDFVFVPATQNLSDNAKVEPAFVGR